MKSSLIFLAVLLGTTTIGYFATNYLENEVFPLPVYSEENHVIEDFELTNQKGEKFISKEHENKIWVVNYFFTICPTVCPQMMRNVQSVHNIVRNENDILLLSFTVDPQRDTAGRLMEYTERFNINHDNWQLLTGEKQDLYRLARQSFLVSATEGNGDDTDFIHSENIVIIDKDRKIRGMVNGTAPNAAQQVLDIISRLKKLGVRSDA